MVVCVLGDGSSRDTEHPLDLTALIRRECGRPEGLMLDLTARDGMTALHFAAQVLYSTSPPAVLRLNIITKISDNL